MIERSEIIIRLSPPGRAPVVRVDASEAVT
jgi:hypothetical protein